MTIINTRFSKICKKCGEKFIPFGKYQRVCEDCTPKQENTFWNRMQRLSRRKQRLKENLKVPSKDRKFIAEKNK